MYRGYLHRPSKRTLGIGVALLAIACIAVAAYDVTGSSSSSVGAPKAPSKPQSVQKVVSTLNSQLFANYAFFRETVPIAQTTVGYQLPGDNFQLVLPISSLSFEMVDESTTDEQVIYSDFSSTLTLINGYLVSQGFTAVTAQDQTSGLLNAVYFYKRSDAVCQLSIYQTLSITCVPLSQLAASAVSVRPLITAYDAASPNSGTDIVVAPTVQNSETAGYTIAMLPIYNNRGQTNANFYKHGDGAWQIVNLSWYNDPHQNANILPNCADFESSTPVREAFTGQTCYDSTTRAERFIGS